MKLNKKSLCIMTLFHDIGYCKSINNLNFHPLDGAIYLEKKSIKPEIVCAIAHHSKAKMLSEGKFKNIYDNKYLIDTNLKRLHLNIIDLIDAHIDSYGNLVDISERYLNISKKYGKDSIQSKAFTALINRIKKLEKEFNWNLI